MDGTVPKIFYNFYLNFMNFLIFLNSRGPGSKFQISSGGTDLWSGGPGPLGPPAATPLFVKPATQLQIMQNHEGHA